MTELKAKRAAASSSSSSSSSAANNGAALLREPHRCDLPNPFRREAIEAMDLSLDGLLYPKSSDDDDEEEEEEEEDEEQKAYLPLEEEEERKGNPSPPADKEALDRVLDTFLAPSAPQPHSDGPPAPWAFFGSESHEVPGALMSRRRPDGKTGDPPAAAAAAAAASSSPWTTAAKGVEGAAAATAALAPLRGSAEQDFDGAARSSSSSQVPSATTGRVQDQTDAGGGQEYVHVPLLPLNPAFLAARTRQLLDVDEGAASSPFGAPQRRASPPPCNPQDFADYLFAPKEARRQQQQHYLYAASSSSSDGDFQPALKIKEETLVAVPTSSGSSSSHGGGIYLSVRTSPASLCDYAPLAVAPAQPRNGSSSSSSSHEAAALDCLLYKAEGAAAEAAAAGPSAAPADSYGLAPCKASTSCLTDATLSLPSTSSALPQALYQPVALHAAQHFALQPAGFKDGLPQFYPPYLSYIRSETEAGHSPQYAFESLPQKICLICGDEASGCHYGVLTCGSCKVFFKRAMEGQHNYLCAGRNDCIVDKIRRKNCPACRLRKCCQAGMVLGGRKFKKFSKVKVIRALDVVALQQTSGALPGENQVLAQRLSMSPSQDIQFIPPLISVLQGIEPEVVYAGYDNTQPETPSALLTSLNQLCERQLLCVVKWSKSLPGFRNLHIDDQITLIQYSWMSLMVFAMGWRSFKHVSGQMLYFAPDLILNEQRMKESSFYSLCLSMWQIPQEFVKLQVSHEEFLCMKALLLLNTIPLEGLRSQNQFDEMRSSYIRELVKAIGLRQKGVVASSQRFYQLTKLLDSMHELVKQLHLYCLNTFLQSRALSVEFPEMMSEVIAAQLPKILAGMVKPLLFHKK